MKNKFAMWKNLNSSSLDDLQTTFSALAINLNVAKPRVKLYSNSIWGWMCGLAHVISFIGNKDCGSIVIIWNIEQKAVSCRTPCWLKTLHWENNNKSKENKTCWLPLFAVLFRSGEIHSQIYPCLLTWATPRRRKRNKRKLINITDEVFLEGGKSHTYKKKVSVE